MGGFLAQARVHNRRRMPFFALVGLVIFVVAVVVMFIIVGQAQGNAEQDSSTLGVGTSQTTSADALSSEERATSSANVDAASLEVSEAADPTQTAQRSITVKDPDPVVVPVAIDRTNSKAIEKAKEVCELNPLPTAKRIAPDVTDGTWSTGIASAYAIANNDDGKGNFGVTDTASGIDLTDSSVTVAVPASKAHLLGSIVEVCYDGKVVIATVTDTGGFARYGRDLDFAPGVWKALGASSCSDWGTRTVHYRFL